MEDLTNWDYEPIKLRDLKKGEYFTLKPIAYPKSSQVFIKDDYVRGEKKFGCSRCSDILGDWKLVKGDTTVYTGFIY